MSTSKKAKIDPKIAASAEDDEVPEDARNIAGEAEARTPRVADHAERRDRLRGPERDQAPDRADWKSRKGNDGL